MDRGTGSCYRPQRAGGRPGLAGRHPRRTASGSGERQMSNETRNTGAVASSGAERHKITRRGLLKATVATAGAAATAGTASLATGAVPRLAYAAGSDEPIRIGFQVHRTGIGATLRPLVRTHRERGGGLDERERRDRGAAGRDRARGRRHRSEARRRGGREAREPAQGGLRLRHPVLPRRHRLRAKGGRARDPLLRGQRGAPTWHPACSTATCSSRGSPTCGHR